MKAPQIPQESALRAWLYAIAGGAPRDQFFEIRPLERDTFNAAPTRAWIPLSDVDRAMGEILRLAQCRDLHVFAGVLPRAVEGGGGIEHVGDGWLLWVDVDGKDALRRLAAFEPKPSIVIRSGSPDHAHAYWPLREGLSPSWIKQGNLRLVRAIGTDRGAADAARILRPPCTFNVKHDPATPVVCTRLETDTFAASDVIGGLEDDPAFSPKPKQRPIPVGCGDPDRTIAGLVDVLAGKTEGERNAGLYWCCAKVAEKEGLPGFDTARALGELHDTALVIGLPEREIERTIASAMRAGGGAAA